MGNDLIELLGYTKLKHLHILQNRYTPNDVNILAVNFAVWKKCRKDNPGLNVHLQVQSVKEKVIIWQQNAPVRTVLYDSPHIGVSINVCMKLNSVTCTGAWPIGDFFFQLDIVLSSV